MYALVDCNSFYASAECVFQPWMWGKPVVVLSNNDGCVIARSAEAKALGIAMGALPFEIKDLIQRHGVEVFSSNYVLYGDMSDRVMSTLRLFSPNIEYYSIDEAFLDVFNLVDVDLMAHAREIRSTVRRHTGIPVSVGMGPTKTLAKAANKAAKKNGGVFLIGDDAARRALLGSMDVEDVWGISRRTGAKLKPQGVHTALQFAEANAAWVRKTMGVVGARLQLELNGTPCADLELHPPAKQMICTSRSFGSNQTHYGDVEEAVMTFASRCAAKLRAQGSAAQLMQVFVHTNAFREDLAQYSNARTAAFPVASNSAGELCHYARGLLRRIWREGYAYKKAGVIVSGIVPEAPPQIALWDERPRERERVAMAVLDRMNARYGRDTVRVSAQGYTKRWRLRQGRLTPAYTTRWHELQKVKV
jgi:DNA polymerase V